MDASPVAPARAGHPTDDAPAAATALTLSTLPDDVLHLIWTHVNQPALLALTNKRFFAISKGVYWRARWLVQRYESYEVFFEAVARPKIFTTPLVSRLLRLGAPLAINMAQLLYHQHNATSRAGGKVGNILWGRGIGFEAYTTVMSAIARMCGDKFPVEPRQFFSNIFTNWLRDQSMSKRKRDTPPLPHKHVRHMFEHRKFVPLALSLVDVGKAGVKRIDRRDNDVTAALILDPALVPLALKNGYALKAIRTEQLIDGWYREFQDFGMVMGFVRDLLKLSPVLAISKHYANRSWTQANGPKPRNPSDGQTQRQYDFWRQIELHSSRVGLGKRALLLELDQANVLPFRLYEVIAELAYLAPRSSSKRKANEDEDVEFGMGIQSSRPLKKPRFC